VGGGGGRGAGGGGGFGGFLGGFFCWLCGGVGGLWGGGGWGGGGGSGGGVWWGFAFFQLFPSPPLRPAVEANSNTCEWSPCAKSEFQSFFWPLPTQVRFSCGGFRMDTFC